MKSLVFLNLGRFRDLSKLFNQLCDWKKTLAKILTSFPVKYDND